MSSLASALATAATALMLTLNPPAGVVPAGIHGTTLFRGGRNMVNLILIVE